MYIIVDENNQQVTLDVVRSTLVLEYDLSIPEEETEETESTEGGGE